MLHASDTMAETLSGGRWPCRLFVVEPRGSKVIKRDHKYGCAAWKVVEEIEAWQALGPNGREVAKVIEQVRSLTSEQTERMRAARVARDAAAQGAAWVAQGAAWDAAREAAREAARDAAREALSAAIGPAWDPNRDAWEAARDAGWGVVADDLITSGSYDLLAGPWESVMGRVFG